MAFDQSTRGRLQKLVNSCRGLLSDEFSIQLQQTYGLDPKTGEVTPMARLTHLDDRQRHTAEVLRQTLAHYLGADADDTDHRIALLDRMVREQAFTVLNRLAALLMMEARGQLIESVSKGYQSRGYQLYSKIAGTALGETGQAYQVYLFSVFDELAQELPALFDRYAANGLLFPRETALRALLDELNHFEIEPLWAADETIGWIYQYFNSKEERKAMRDASQVPRNSRELAVRNQFFTPRYVVEFLVDNTLGRLWFNATGGQTDLRARCRYLQGPTEKVPQASAKLRDPRTLKLLDPACGSMHFGLYAFDLFAEIYREAWAWEQQYGLGSLDVSAQPQATLKPLSQTYDDEATFLRDVPRLIIEHNIYGVDIDPRAAQIATLALWLRAQRAWHDAGVKAKDRPLIGRGHVVAAIAPPAERELREQFVASLDSSDAELFEKTLQMLKGLPELGVLLQVERELPDLIRQVYVGKGTGLFAAQELESWQQAEARLREALNEFAQAAKSSYQSRLFAQDALQGLRLIDLCREVFDVIVMNPPFGAPSKSSKSYIDKVFSRSRNDLLCVFIDRSVDLLAVGGHLGCITSRTVLFLTSFSEWRESILLESAPPSIVADLGHGVLDAAMVETAAYCLTKGANSNAKIPFLRLGQMADREEALKTLIDLSSQQNDTENIFRISPGSFRKIPGSPFSYWISEEFRNLFGKFRRFESDDVVVRVTNPTADNFRYLRNHWECVASLIGKDSGWVPYAKGGSSKRYYYDVNLLAMWDPRVPTYKGYQGTVHRTDIRPASLDYFFRPGIMWPLRAPRMCAQAFPEGTAFSARSQCLFAERSSLPYFLGLMNSSALDYLFKAALGRTDFPEFIVGVLRNLPKPSPSTEIMEKISSLAMRAAKSSRKFASFDEVDHMFLGPRLALVRDATTLAEAAEKCFAMEENWLAEIDSCQAEIDALVLDAYGLSADAASEIAKSTCLTQAAEGDMAGFEQNQYGDDDDEAIVTSDAKDLSSLGQQLFSWLVGCAFGRWSTSISVDDIDAQTNINLFGNQPITSKAALSLNGRPSNQGVHSILVDDPGHQADIVGIIETLIERTWNNKGEVIESELCSMTNSKSLRTFLSKGNGFFDSHYQQYSKSGRKAPIYWPLATTSSSYTLWIYYPSLNSQTLFTAVNDFLDGPNGKLTQVSRECAELRMKGGGRSRDEEKQYEMLQTFEQELTDLRDTLLKIAPTYQPNHDDGVQITAAPLWPLFRHKPWQKVLKDTWTKLEKGDYDWAHLAMAYWPERVREKCKTDKSLAIAHGLEDLYVEPEAAPKKTRGRKKAGGEE